MIAHDNPTIDAVMNEVLATIREGCAPMTVTAEAEAEFLRVYQPRFGARLEIGSWHNDKTNVLRASRQMGIIASAIATVRHETTASVAVIMEAGAVVRKHCQDVFREGVWCSTP